MTEKKYEPTAEEITKAKNLMTTEQRDLTRDREEAKESKGENYDPAEEYERIKKELGVDASIDRVETYSNGEVIYFRGKINDHEIQIQNDGQRLGGYIDGVEISSKSGLRKEYLPLLQRLWNKFLPLAKSSDILHRHEYRVEESNKHLLDDELNRYGGDGSTNSRERVNLKIRLQLESVEKDLLG